MKSCLFEDLHPLRQEDGFVPLFHVARRQHDVPGFPHFGAGVDGQALQLSLSPLVLGLQSGDGGLSRIEDGELDVQGRAHHTLPVRALLVRDPDVDAHRKVARLLLESQGATHGLDSPSRGLDIQAIGNGERLQILGGDLLPRERGEAGGNLPFDIGAPEPHEPIQAFAVAASLDSGRGHRYRRLTRRGFAAEEFQSVDVARDALPARELRGGLLDIENERQPLRQLLAGGQGEERDLGVRHGANQFVPDAELRRLQLGGGELLAERLHKYVEEVLNQGDFKVLTGRGPVRESDESRKMGICDPAGLGEVRLSDPKVLEGCLKVAVVDERYPRRRVRVQFVLQDASDQGLDFLCFRGRPHETCVFSGSLSNLAADVDERCAGIDGGTAAADAHHPQQHQKTERSLHFFSLGFLTSGIPQIGHFPGLGSAICGCITQV